MLTFYRTPAFWLIFLTVAVYANSLPNGWTFDDHMIVETNPIVHSLDLKQIFGSHYWPDRKDAGLYRPLTILSFSVHYALHGAAPFFYHLVNVIFHAANVLLVYALANRFQNSVWVAASTALIFGLHPVQTEAVNGIVGRAELMSAFWVLLAWLLYIRSGVGRGERLNRFYGLSLTAALLGMLSKENAACAVGLLMVYDWVWEHRGRWPGGWRGCLKMGLPRYVPYVVLVFGFLFLRSQVIGSVFLPVLPGEAENILPHLQGEVRWLTTLSATGVYFRLLVFPLWLMPDYSNTEIPVIGSFLDPLAWGPLVVMLGLGGLVFLWIFRQYFLSGALGVLVFAVGFFPVSNFFVTIGTILGERLLYLPMVGFVIFVGAILSWLVSLAQERRYVYAGVAIVLGLCGVQTIIRSSDWRNDVTLFLAAVHDGNRSAKVYYNLGVGYRKQKRFDKAIEAFERVVEQKPDEPDSWKYLGIVYAEKGQHAKAAGVYEVALKLDSTQVDLWKRLGGQREALEDWERAERMYARALALADDDTDLHFSMARMCRRINRPACAIRHCLFVLDADADYRDAAVMLGQLYVETGQLEEARALVDAIRTRWPDVPEVLVLVQKLGMK